MTNTSFLPPHLIGPISTAGVSGAMADHSRFLPRPLYRRDVRWEPFCEETLPSRIYKPDAGLPPFLEPGDLSWIQWAQRRLAASAWPGYMPPPLFTPTSPYPSPGTEQPRGVSEIRTGPESWKINLDVSCFSPREITIRTREGYLEISGNHEDRQDEYGLVSKCFSRKYKLPAGSDLRHIRSALSGGVLSVEAPHPSMAQEIPVEIIIPVQIEKRSPESREETKAGETVPPVVSQENSVGAQAANGFPAGIQEKSNGPRVTAIPLTGIQENREVPSEAATPPAGNQENSEGLSSAGNQETNGLLEKQTAVMERVSSSPGAEPVEDKPVGGEDNVEEASQEERAQANLDGVGQEGQDLSQTAPEGLAHEAQSSALDSVQSEEKKVEARWTHRDTKWMTRSTKWPSQQY
ncbi:heat shock protein 67B1-like isoform X2 [Conger conger]|uniref:heat shock protein 67B1-like isoform X2 n=1 Tax=Conger conger TaxID=82655 RepID=UPI002A59F1C1|nr:heat shock protein 67B1-like isoform X2 [Conger conger]